VIVVEDRAILSAEYRLPLLAKTDPPCNAVSLRYLSYLLFSVASKTKATIPDTENDLMVC